MNVKLITSSKKALTAVLSTLILAVSAVATPVFAQAVKIENPVLFPDLESIINFFLGLVRPIIILVFIGTLMYGGWVYLNAKDDAGQTKKAKQIITASIIGFIIIVLAPVIVQLAGSLLGINQAFLNPT